MTLLGWVGLTLGAVVALLVAEAVYLSVVLRWEDEKTNGIGYYGLPAPERARFKRTLGRHAFLLYPILRLAGRSKLDFRKARFQHRGVSGPTGSCSAESFARAEGYRPRPEDVFVVTQMKCGTTWMQHVVYEILHRGGGNLVETGTALYAVSPWLEGRKSVSIEQAPLLGTERPSRIIKTHLPASLCPFSPEARYVYVARHPLSCFASCVDFVRTNVGGMAPEIEAFEEWFTTPELMWWATWTEHVKGWWQLARREHNVLFLHFEEMKRNLLGIIRQVAEFLGVAPLTDAELARIAEKCGFEYMQRHQEAFEMHPPHILQTDAELFVRGTADRHKDVPDLVQRRIRSWCVKEMEGGGFPLELAYPDVVAASSQTGPAPR